MENNISRDRNENASLKNTKLKDGLKDVWDLIRFAIIALIIVIPIRLFIAQPFVVSGDSMIPTFHDKEYLIVDEISYILGQPHRGQVVIFRFPKEPSRFFIKRIIGLPNEEIIIEHGKITIKNESHPNGFVLEEPYINGKFDYTGTFKTATDQFFVLGDNRNFSSDSRTWGLLPKNLMIGKAFLRLLPFDQVSYLPGDFKVKN